VSKDEGEKLRVEGEGLRAAQIAARLAAEAAAKAAAPPPAEPTAPS